MEQYLAVLAKSRLFWGLGLHEIRSVLGCLGAYAVHYNRAEHVFSEGAVPDKLGLVLEGEVQIRKTDYEGNVHLVTRLYAGDCIAVAANYASDKRFPFDAVCVSPCEILKMDAKVLIQPCGKACPHHCVLTANLLAIIADRSMRLTEKIDILTKHTLKEKIMTYLHLCAHRAKNRRFSIPLSRRGMAELLSVNRSALSRELSALKSQGVLDFDANHFQLL